MITKLSTPVRSKMVAKNDLRQIQKFGQPEAKLFVAKKVIVHANPNGAQYTSVSREYFVGIREGA